MELTQVTCINKLIRATGDATNITFFENALDQARENFIGSDHGYDKKSLMRFIENSQLQPVEQILFQVTDVVIKSKEEFEERNKVQDPATRQDTWGQSNFTNGSHDQYNYQGLNVPSTLVSSPELGAVVLVAVKFKHQPTKLLEYALGWDAKLATLQFANNYFPTTATIVEGNNDGTTTAYMMMLYTEIVEICQWMNDIDLIIQHHVDNHCVPERFRGYGVRRR